MNNRSTRLLQKTNESLNKLGLVPVSL
jgi:hypothetical protein